MTLIQLRGGTAAAWSSANTVLAAREFGVETDTLKFKMGNGSTAWNSLAYQGTVVGPASAIDNQLALFSGVTGKSVKAAAFSGLVKLAAGAASAAVAGTDYYSPGGGDVALADGGTGTSLIDPNADRLMFWDDSAGAMAFLTPGTNLSITGTTINAAGGAGGGGISSVAAGNNIDVDNTDPANPIVSVEPLTLADVSGTLAQLNASVTDADIASIAGAEVLANKTLSTPTITGYTETVNPLGVVGASRTLGLSGGTMMTATLTPLTTCAFTMPTPGAGKSFSLLLSQPSAGSPAYNSSAMSANQSNLASGTPFTFTQTTAAAGAYAIVAVHNGDTALTTAATINVTFGGVSMSALGVQYAHTGLPDNGFVKVYALPSIAGGSNQTVSVTVTEAGHLFTGYAESYTYTGVASVGSLITGSGQSTLPSVTVTSATGNRVWGTVMNDGAETFSGFGLTQRQGNNVGTTFPQFLAGDAAGAATVAVSATKSAGGYWAALGLNLVGSGVGSATFTGVKWPGATPPTITATAGAMDLLTFFSDGTNWYGSVTQGYV